MTRGCQIDTRRPECVDSTITQKKRTNSFTEKQRREKVKTNKKVGFDLDDVLRKTYKEAIRIWIETVDPAFSKKIDELATWVLKDFFVHKSIPDCVNHLFVKHAMEISLNPRPMKDAARVTRQLREEGYEVVIVTALFDECVEYSKKWLAIYDIQYDDLIVTKDKTKFDGLCLLDDGLHNLHAISTSNSEVVPVCFDKPWNRANQFADRNNPQIEHSWEGHRVYSLEEYFQWILEEFPLCKL